MSVHAEPRWPGLSGDDEGDPPAEPSLLTWSGKCPRTGRLPGWLAAKLDVLGGSRAGLPDVRVSGAGPCSASPTAGSRAAADLAFGSGASATNLARQWPEQEWWFRPASSKWCSLVAGFTSIPHTGSFTSAAARGVWCSTWLLTMPPPFMAITSKAQIHYPSSRPPRQSHLPIGAARNGAYCNAVSRWPHQHQWNGKTRGN